MTVAQKISATYLGAYSVGSRGGWVNAQKVDTLVKAVQARYKNRMRHAEVVVKDAKINKHDILPNYDFKLNVQMDMNKLIQKTEDGNYSLDFKYWLEHNVRTVVNIENRELDYHVPFIGTDVEDFFLIFDKDIEFVNQNDFMADIADENVEYQCKISQVKPNTIRIESRYKVKKLFIEKSNLESLDEANQAIKKLNEAKLIFKVK